MNILILIQGIENKKAYVATQGPIPRTFDDFWRMIWELKSVSIVMLGREIENMRVLLGFTSTYSPTTGKN